MTDAPIEIPGYRAGTWELDPAHSEVAFSVSHLMISTVRGVFRIKSATVITPENPLESRIEASVVAASLDTGIEARDSHLRSADFLDVGRFPTIEFVSGGARLQDGNYLVDGNLTVHGVTVPVTFECKFFGFAHDLSGAYKAGASATTTIDREMFGLTWNAALEAGGVLVGREVTITMSLEGSFVEDPALQTSFSSNR